MAPGRNQKKKYTFAASDQKPNIQFFYTPFSTLQRLQQLSESTKKQQY
jgi:hypothetical protein